MGWIPAFVGLTGVLCSLKRCTTQLKIPGLNLTAILAARNVKERVAVALCVAALSFAVVSGLRYAGGLERIELPVHDRIIESRGGRPAHPDVVVILETEADLQRFGHPLSDGKLAELLQRLKNLNPALMAVDKYRDLPVAPGSAALDKFLMETPNIFWVAKYGAAAFDGVRPPKVLDGSEQVACADIVVDADLRVRRTPSNAAAPYFATQKIFGVSVRNLSSAVLPGATGRSRYLSTAINAGLRFFNV